MWLRTLRRTEEIRTDSDLVTAGEQIPRATTALRNDISHLEFEEMLRHSEQLDQQEILSQSAMAAGDLLKVFAALQNLRSAFQVGVSSSSVSREKA